MELREYAETIFRAQTLEGKLLQPSVITDVDGGKAWNLAGLPGRPKGLEMIPAGGRRVAFPGFGELEDERARGTALHFFANHELLALELMALALLKFPNADRTWRNTIFATMRDEQKHLQIYVKRMKELGVELGEIPLNRFFWDHISTMEVPLDFTVRMSLTFEQANLDFSLLYRDAFAKVGDETSATLMQEVLDDEIGHVRHGVRALEAARTPDTSLWDTYRTALPYPMTPARAKGKVFFQGPREEAELPHDFIDSLRVYRHTRGRPPVVRVFNPATEAALGQGIKGHTPNRLIHGLAKDLEMLPCLLGVTDDVVLVREIPDPEHLKRMAQLGWPRVEWVKTPLDTARIAPEHTLIDRQISGIEPWGWDPTIADYLTPLQHNLPEHFPTLEDFVSGTLNWSSKTWMAEQLSSILEKLPSSHLNKMVVEHLPIVAKSLEEARITLKRNREVGTGRVVFKAPFGTAGRDAIRVDGESLQSHEEKWITRVINQQGSVVSEAWYDRVLDVSYQFLMRSDGTFKSIGLTRFLTDERGQYLGSIVAPLGSGLDSELKRFLFDGNGGSWVQQTLETLSREIGTALYSEGFRGRAGIDGMLVREPSGRIALRAPLELNPRATMGHVALEAARPIGSRAVSCWTLLTPALAKKNGFSCVKVLFEHLRDILPELWRDKTPVQGVYPLNDPKQAESAVGVLIVCPDMTELLAHMEHLVQRN